MFKVGDRITVAGLMMGEITDVFVSKVNTTYYVTWCPEYGIGVYNHYDVDEPAVEMQGLKAGLGEQPEEIEVFVYDTEAMKEVNFKGYYNEVHWSRLPKILPESAPIKFELNEAFELTIREAMALDRLNSLVKIKSPACSHEWSPYQGLTETYEFCTKCDEKKT